MECVRIAEEENKLAELLFSSFLILVSWHDLRACRIPVVLFVLFGFVGVCGVMGGWNTGGDAGIRWIALSLAFLPGLFLLGLTSLTRGAIGAGDSCFFLVSACYLTFSRLVLLLLVGLLFCSALCLGMTVWGMFNQFSVRKLRLPFLPFLVPAWIWIMIVQAP